MDGKGRGREKEAAKDGRERNSIIRISQSKQARTSHNIKFLGQRTL